MSGRNEDFDLLSLQTDIHFERNFFSLRMARALINKIAASMKPYNVGM
jgi:hypothetical protein